MFLRRKRGDERIIACPAQRVLIVVNFKCGFATLNHELNRRPEIRTRNPAGLKRWREWRRWEHVLFYRDPVERLLSFYNNWIVTRTERDLIEKGKRNFYREILLAEGGPSVYQRFLHASREEKASTPMVREFLAHLPGYLEKDGHVVPQSRIYRRAGLEPDFFHRILPTSQTVVFLRERFGIDAHVRNRTGSAEKLQAVDRGVVESFCREHYAQDYEDLPLD